MTATKKTLATIVPNSLQPDKMSDKLWQFKVTLQHSKPAAWRRLVISPEITFSQFAQILLIICDFAGDHLYGFEVGLNRKLNDKQHAFFTDELGERKADDFFKDSSLNDLAMRYGMFSSLNWAMNEGDGDLKDSDKIVDYVDFENKNTLTFTYNYMSSIKLKIQLEKVLDAATAEIAQIPICLKAVNYISDGDTDDDDIWYDEDGELKDEDELEELSKTFKKLDLDKINAALQNPDDSISGFEMYEDEMNSALGNN
jgi:hypothetical protein